MNMVPPKQITLREQAIAEVERLRSLERQAATKPKRVAAVSRPAVSPAHPKTLTGRIFRSQALKDGAIRRRAMRQRLAKKSSDEPVVMLRVRMAGAR